MTDGIIQQIRKKYESHNHRTDLGQDNVQRYLDRYTQELIEKIKQEFGQDDDYRCNCSYCLIMKKLIGDNKE